MTGVLFDTRILLDVGLSEVPSTADNEIQASAKTLKHGYATGVREALCAEPNHHTPVKDTCEQGEAKDDPT